ncbi:MAG: 4-alpha-glucanotransferase [Butyrivibrio sp.]|jgi:4-alpha-glucanotransferase|uniref:4-alpha-glucanotransferase n=1 Tax=Butyrivibrio sp. TaxID=28121 RepID=UPI001EC8CD8A|nr:4-alpha-glucanotransferase [Butyrivibrio sp.]MBE5841719.1 4-alpha-glucanotransferase [Butyrivibrio sp.]
MAKNKKKQTRRCGVLLPIFSLSSEYGIGAFSKEAYEFVDFLSDAGQSYWQILPLGPTSYGDSPYQSFSTFAGNPYFIDINALITDGLLTKKQALGCDFGGTEEKIDYEKLYRTRFKLLKTAYDNVDKSPVAKEIKKEFEAFKKNPDNDWLSDYALFMALKDANNGRAWNTWSEDIKLRKKDALKKAHEKYKEEVDFYSFLQYLFSKQWEALKSYANSKGIEIIGDIPIYVAFDSADTWANPELFLLDKENTPIDVAGCPPDAFSATGQLWGNPLYRWDYHKKTGYKWWLKRISQCYKLYDVVRIDHFRGFDEYYAIPYGNPTAEIGEWRKGPGYDLFDVMKRELGDKKVIAEDLGFLTDTVIGLVKKTGFPGMKILEFAFDSREESDYLPHNYTKNCIVYTGTHDNETARGWFDHLPRNDKRFAKEYLGIHYAKDAVWAMIRAAFASVSDTAIIPMQDYLELGAYARINTPSTLGGNWTWRMKKDALSKELCQKMYDYARIYGRLS